ncbi:hypothetical protein IMSHALPRED_003969 [Imshaugia aleurites]|uniref:RING-type domain-containing protein n=1 Tax=Imshaugia aleurites TaxID=172621 RepID=A0A8H3HWW3_9LECA|nr:hypothetical protein IMSHALPRED_003969 [Imshaugia aleurites]
MPISPKTLSDLKTTTAHFDFLLTAPAIKIKTIPPDARTCAICQEPFDNNVRKPGDAVNRPVQLDCGHIFGITCLAHLVFTSDFRNRCPLCRAPVVAESFGKNPSAHSWKVAVPLLRILMMFGGGGASFEKKRALDVLENGLQKEGLTGAVEGKHMHRVMVLYEEFLSRFCEGVEGESDAERLAAAEGSVQELLRMMDRRQELQRRVDETREAREQAEERFRESQEQELEIVKGALEEARKEAEETRVALEHSKKDLEDARKDGQDAKREIVGLKKILRTATKRFEELREELEKAKREMAGKPSGWFFHDVGMTVAVVLVHFEGHSFKNSNTLRVVLGLWLIRCTVAGARSQTSRRSWLIIALVIVCGLLILGTLSLDVKENLLRYWRML